MRLAFTHPYSWPDVRRGSERIVVESARALADRGHEVTILTSGRVPLVEVRDGVRTVKLRQRFADPRRHERWFGASVVPHLLRGRFDAVHSMMPRDARAAVSTRRLTGHRVIYEELGLPARWFWAEVPDGRLRRRLVWQVDVYGVMSNYALDILADDWGRQGALIPGGVRLTEFQPAPRSEQPTILFSGALTEERKGLPTLLAAMDQVLDARPQARLLLSGPGDPAAFLEPVGARVRAAVDHLPIGDPQTLGSRYATAWVTTLPSVGDSFGMALIESLAAGTPIVVADHGAPPQLTTPDTGIVVPAGDAAALAHGLLDGFRLAEDPRTVDRCRTFAAQFDWDTSLAGILEDLYRSPGRR